ncbi:WecB/TagA/CpsF family glycosyltransferase [Azospirillum sp. sgz301742]
MTPLPLIRSDAPPRPEVPRSEILGTPVSMVSLDRAVALSAGWIRARTPTYVCHLDARSVLAARDDPDVRAAYAGAGLAAPDGMPLVWMGRARGFPVTRVYGPDFMGAMLAHTATWIDRPCRHLLFGATNPVLDRLAARLRSTYPGALIAGAFAPPMGTWSEATEREHCAVLNAVGADVIWVGLGAPRQDLWMARNRARLEAPLLVGVGAAFDFLSRSKAQAPLWLRSAGLEWAFRLATEPRRLAARYGATVPRFAALALAEEAARRLSRR